MTSSSTPGKKPRQHMAEAFERGASSLVTRLNEEAPSGALSDPEESSDADTPEPDDAVDADPYITEMNDEPGNQREMTVPELTRKRAVTLTFDDARDIGKYWYNELSRHAFLSIHPRTATARFARWSAILLRHLGAQLVEITDLSDLNLFSYDVSVSELADTDIATIPSPSKVGFDLAYELRLAADAVTPCIIFIDDLAAEYAPHAARAIRAHVVGEFAGGYCLGMQRRIRDEQTALTDSIAQALLTRAHQQKTVLDAASLMVYSIVTLDRTGRIVEANSASQTLLGRPFDTLQYRQLTTLATAEDRPTVDSAVASVLNSAEDNAVATVEFRYAEPALDSINPARLRWLTAQIGRISSAGQSRSPGVNVVLHDITVQHAVSAGASIDAHTGALTEAAFLREANLVLANDEPAAMLTIRAGAGTTVNVTDAEIGTHILRRITALLSRADDATTAKLLVGRSTDDIIVLVHQFDSWAVVTRLTKALSRWLREPIRIGPHRIHLRPRIGLDTATRGRRADELLRSTRTALRPPARHTAPWNQGDQHTEQHEQHKFDLLGQLTAALENEQLRIGYHPVFRTGRDGRTATLVGAHVVPYWTGPDQTIHPVCEILDLAATTGLLTTVLPAALTLACRDLDTWRTRNFTPFLTLDLPADTVQEEDTLNQLTTIAGRHNLTPNQLHLAIPAQAIAEPDEHRTLNRLTTVTNTGVALDLYDLAGNYLPTQALRALHWHSAALTRSTIDTLSDPASPSHHGLTGVLSMIDGFNTAALADGLPADDSRTTRFTFVRPPTDHLLTADNILSHRQQLAT